MHLHTLYSQKRPRRVRFLNALFSCAFGILDVAKPAVIGSPFRLEKQGRKIVTVRFGTTVIKRSDAQHRIDKTLRETIRERTRHDVYPIKSIRYPVK